MIVRNEAAIIERCLDALAPVIDYFVIVDTGSTDDTIVRVQSLLGGRGIAGEVHKTEFADFATTRNEALELCRHSSAAFDYILLADADMQLRIEEPRFRETLSAEAYRVRQHGGSSYDNVRLLRRNVPAHYVGATHEFLGVEGSIERLSALSFIDHQDGSSRWEKAERDLRLLRRALQHDPSDARSMFYLAQTLRETGRLEEAAEWYRSRIDAGGWVEEVWYSRWMLALCQTEGTERVRLCMEAWQSRPHRAEPLHSIANHFRLNGDSERAMVFAEKGRTMPYPANDLLFIDDRIYREGFDEEVSICGYYSPDPSRRFAGREACFSLATRRDVSGSTRAIARSNSAFYAARFDEMFPGATACSIPFTPEPGWLPANPSITRTSAGWVGIIRTVNYRIENGSYQLPAGDRVVRTRNHLVRLTDSFDISSTREIDEASDAPVLPEARIRGYEDCRIFAWRSGLWASATVADRSDRCEMILLELDFDGTVRSEHRMPGPVADRHEKNWAPLVFGEELLFLYLSDPTILMRYDPASETVTELTRQIPPFALEHLRGGSQLVPVDDGWIYLAHDVSAVHGSERVYLHRFVHLNDAFAIDAITDPFYFARKGIEFASGLARDGDCLVASFGVNDGAAHLATFDLPLVVSQLHRSADPADRSRSVARTVPEPAKRLTLVTALFDLQRREPSRERGLEFYLRSGETILSLNQDLVIFTEPELVATIAARRRSAGLESRTHLVPLRLEDFPVWSDVDRIRVARDTSPVHNENPRKDTALYVALTWSKFWMVGEAIRRNPHQSTHFGWIDLGLSHVASFRHAQEDGIFTTPSDRIGLTTMRPFDRRDVADLEDYLSLVRGFVACGYLAGSRAAMEKLVSRFENRCRDSLARGFAPSEEQILPLIALDHPELFDVVYADYRSILDNQVYLRSPVNLLFQLRLGRERGDWDRGADIARRLLQSLESGRFEGSPLELAELFEELSLAAEQAEAPLNDLASRIDRHRTR